MFAKIINDKIVEYPYLIYKLKEENSNCSFSENFELDLELLEHFNIFKILPTPQPEYDKYNYKLELATPHMIKNRWFQKWKIIKLSTREKDIILENKKQEVINLRNTLLSETDWTQCRDVDEEVSKKWIPYRQALRDITLQENFPLNVEWPLKP